MENKACGGALKTWKTGPPMHINPRVTTIRRLTPPLTTALFSVALKNVLLVRPYIYSHSLKKVPVYLGLSRVPSCISPRVCRGLLVGGAQLAPRPLASGCVPRSMSPPPLRVQSSAPVLPPRAAFLPSRLHRQPKSPSSL